MRSYSFALITTAALALAAPVAHAQVPFEIEGPIQSVEQDGTGAKITVMGIEIQVPAGIPISSPTKQLTVEELRSTASLPGRDGIPGFVGGTAIISGISEPDERIAAEVFVEPAENVVVGQITGPQQIEGMSFEFINDPRIPAIPVKNAFGFVIDVATLLLGTPASLEGYYSAAQNKFYAFLLEAEGGQLANPGREVSILRAECRQRTNGQLEIEVRGATHNPATGTVSVSTFDGSLVYGTAAVTPDADDPAFGTYRFKRRSGGIGTCQSEIRVTFGTATATAPQDIRID